MSDPGIELPVGTGVERVGTVVADKYRIVRPLGEGGMGAVFEAEHTFLKRRFAIKFLRDELMQSSELVARFRREAQAAGQLEHENIASVTDFGVTPAGTPYFVMEFLDGENLSRIIKREGPLTTPRAVALVLQACRALLVAHARGIVHRDLKPDNLFVCPRDDGTEWIKVLDFGIAKIRLGVGDDGLNTKTGATMGTPYCMSPEQARGDRNVDQRTDIYSLGAVLYETLCGSRPHGGTTYNEIIYYILTREPVSLQELRPELPRGLVSVVEHAMAREATDRFASMAEFAHALAPYCGARLGPRPAAPAVSPHADGTLPTVLSPVSLHAVAVGSDFPNPDSSPGVQREQPRSRRRILLFAAAVFVALGSVGAFWLRISRQTESNVQASPNPLAVATPTSSAFLPNAINTASAVAGSLSASAAAPPASAGVTGNAVPSVASPAGAIKLPKTPAKPGNIGSTGPVRSPKYDHKNPYE